MNSTAESDSAGSVPRGSAESDRIIVGRDGASIHKWPHRLFLGIWFAVSMALLAASLCKVPVPGINEPHYLTKARSFVDPEWCSQDFFLQSADAHFVFFAVTGPLTTLLPFAVVAVVGRLCSLALLALGWCMIGRRLGLSASAVLFSAIAFCCIALTGNLSGEWVIGGFEGKVPSYGFALCGVAVWLDGWRTREHRYYLVAGLLLGASISLHPVVGVWFCIGIAFAELIMVGFRRPHERLNSVEGPRRFMMNGLILTLASTVTALPGLIPAAQMVLSSDLPLEKTDRANFIQVFWRLAHHLDPSTFPSSAWIHTGVLLLLGLVSVSLTFWFAGRQERRTDAISEPIPCLLFWQPILALLLIAGVITGIGVKIGWHDGPVLDLPDWQWRAIVLKFYPFRFFDAFLPMTVALSLGLLVDQLTALTAFTRQLRVVASMVLLAVMCDRSLDMRPAAPAGYTVATYASWQDACTWLQQNTPQDAVIFGPREGFGLKWFAHRAEYVCFKDCPQDAEGILEWNRRLWTIHRWSESSYQDEVFDRSDTEKLHQQTGITHILTRRLGPFAQLPVYDNEHWKIYHIADE